MQEHPNAVNYRRVSKAMEEGDFMSMADGLSDDIEWWEIGSDQPTRGKAALMERMQADDE